MIKSFNLDKALAGDIFGISEDTEVFLLQKEILQLEIFLKPGKLNHSFNHICFSTTRREEITEKQPGIHISAYV